MAYQEEVFGKDTVSLYGISLDLMPKYDTLDPIYLMTCSWGTENGVTSDSSWHIGYHPCDANFMAIRRVDSTYHIKLTTVASNEHLFNEAAVNVFRIGIVIVDTLDYSVSKFFQEDFGSQDDAFEKLKLDEERIVWSNEIELKKMDTSEGMRGMMWMERD